jgi:hypothetical protein
LLISGKNKIKSECALLNNEYLTACPVFIINPQIKKGIEKNRQALYQTESGEYFNYFLSWSSL